MRKHGLYIFIKALEEDDNNLTRISRLKKNKKKNCVLKVNRSGLPIRPGIENVSQISITLQ